MSRIRGKDTKPEITLRSELWRAGLRYNIHGKTPYGRPDVVFARRKVAVFVDGCFWHGCPDHYVRPGSHDDFWRTKLAANVDRDRHQTNALEQDGWRVIRCWEHEVFTTPATVVASITAAIQQSAWDPPVIWRVVGVDVIDPVSRLERRHLEELRGRVPGRSVDRVRVTTKWKTP